MFCCDRIIIMNDILEGTKIYTVDTVSIKPSDIIIIKFVDYVTAEVAEIVKEKISEFFPNNQVMILGNNTEIFIARKEE